MKELKDRVTIKNIIFLLLVIFVIHFICEVKNLALLIFASFVIASSLNPLVDKLSKHMQRSWATITALTGFLAVLIGAFVPLVLIVLEEIHAIFADLPTKIKLLNQFLETKTVFGQHLSSFININPATNQTSEIAGNIFQKSIAASASVVGAFAILFILSMIVFYMLSDKDRMRNWFLQLFPPDIRDKASEVASAITLKVGGFVIAQSTSMLAVGIVTAIGLFILQVPYALALGLIAGILDIVPIVGPIIATLMGVSAAYQQGWGIIIAVVLVYIIAQWISNNLVRPLIFGKFMDLHPLVIILAFLVAAEFLDVWGVILAPAIAAVLAVLFDELYVKQINKKQPPEEKKGE